MENKIGLVLYTDGSARPNPGFIGWGCHGYKFKTKPLELLEKIKGVDGMVITNRGYIDLGVYTEMIKACLEHEDGSDARKLAIKNLPRICEVIEYIDFVGTHPVMGTNNQAEVSACFKTLEHFASDIEVTEVNVFTDSEYMMKGANYQREIWAKNGWKTVNGDSIKNVAEWKSLHHVFNLFKERGVHINVSWVRGHADTLGNLYADSLAVVGCMRSTDNVVGDIFKISPPTKEYWTPTIDKNPLVNFKRLIFNSMAEFNKPGEYYISDPGVSDMVFGKRNPEAGFAVVRLSTPDHCIEAVKERQFQVADFMNAIMMMQLDSVFSRDIYPMIKDHGKYAVVGGSRKKNLNVEFTDETPLTIQMDPTGLSLRGVEAFEMMACLLDEYDKVKAGQTSTFPGLALHEITDIFYEESVKLVKKQEVKVFGLRSEIDGVAKHIDVEIDEQYKGKAVKVKLPLVYGLDILPRNNLKRLETENPRVFVITWRECDETLRYATIVDCSLGRGIWNNFSADRVFLRVFDKS